MNRMRYEEKPETDRILPRFLEVMGIYTAEAVADATAAILRTVIFAVWFPGIRKRMQKKQP